MIRDVLRTLGRAGVAFAEAWVAFLAWHAPPELLGSSELAQALARTGLAAIVLLALVLGWVTLVSAMLLVWRDQRSGH